MIETAVIQIIGEKLKVMHEGQALYQVTNEVIHAFCSTPSGVCIQTVLAPLLALPVAEHKAHDLDCQGNKAPKLPFLNELSHLDLDGLRGCSTNKYLAARELSDPGQVHRAYLREGRLLDDGTGCFSIVFSRRWGRVVG